MLVTKEQFFDDLLVNLDIMKGKGINTPGIKYFLPPYEWYNDSIAAWTNEFGLQLINFTPGTKSTADYTYPQLKNYSSTEEIYNSIINYEKANPSGLNGFVLLLHLGTDPNRTDKFYKRLPDLIKYLKAKDFHFQTVNQLLK